MINRDYYLRLLLFIIPRLKHRPQKNQTPDIVPMEKPVPKYRTSVKKYPIFRELTLQNKYINPSPKYINASANCM